MIYIGSLQALDPQQHALEHMSEKNSWTAYSSKDHHPHFWPSKFTFHKPNSFLQSWLSPLVYEYLEKVQTNQSVEIPVAVPAGLARR